jgi:indolepyruvate ferredoxin oxidoreductase
MVTWMDRDTSTFTQMGGEGAAWIGQAPFTRTRHVFQNLGDGTYIHSGLLAIRAAVAAKVNITYKLLYNDAVAMTGGQPLDGSLSVAQITHQLYGEGVRRITVVSDDPDKYPDRGEFAAGVDFHHRSLMARLQRELRELPGVSVLIYDQTCAAELRRRRRRQRAIDPPKRVFINELVCEGCGDCSAVSNCLSVIPVDTEFGRKRAINQSACNKDFSCVDGFCPSFVTVHGGKLRKPGTQMPEPEGLAEPELPVLEQSYDILITGIGGTGVATIGALLGMAAHIEGKGVAVLDQTGLAQKFGAVVSHVRIAPSPEHIRSVRIPAGGARLLLGCDIVVGAGGDALAKLNQQNSRAVVNSYLDMPSDFIRDRDYELPGCAMRESIESAVGTDCADFLDATRLATRLLGDTIATNLFMVGYAWQKGLIPLGRESIFTAIELNAVAVDMNKRAFAWGRWAAADRASVEAMAGFTETVEELIPDLDTVVARRADFLTAYQNQNYAERYRDLVEEVRKANTAIAPDGHAELAEAVAHNYFKLLAYKDEYEVARLFTDGSFKRKLEAQFAGDYRLKFHLSPPLLARTDPDTGRPRKLVFGSWMMGAFRLLAPLRVLRGTWLDPFGYSRERRAEKRLIRDYEQLIGQILTGLGPDSLETAIDLASLPQRIRGFGPVKAESIEKTETERAELLRQFHARGRKSKRPESTATAA